MSFPARLLARARAFTLLELLVVMGIMMILAVLTATSVSKVTRDAKLANATNGVVASLGAARAIAIRDNAYVMVTFRVAPSRQSRAVPREPQVVQIVTARWTGEVVTSNTPLPTPNTYGAAVMVDDVFADRFVPVPGVPTLITTATDFLAAGPPVRTAARPSTSIISSMTSRSTSH